MELTTIEVFSTNVDEKSVAQRLLAQLGDLYPHYQITIDVEDCDHALVAKSVTGIDVPALVGWLKQNNYRPEILPDELPSPILQELFSPNKG